MARVIELAPGTYDVHDTVADTSTTITVPVLTPGAISDPQPTIGDLVSVTGSNASARAVFQWQQSADGLSGWANISGATAATLDTSSGFASGNYVRRGVSDGLQSIVYTEVLVAPVAATAPSFTGTVAENETITINEGTYIGTTPITITGVLTLDGVDVTADMVAGNYTVPTLTEGQSLVWSETASNGTAPNATQNVSATVAAPLNVVPLPTGVWLEGDSYAGYLSGGFFRETTFEQDTVNTGVGGSTMTAAVARVATNQPTYSDQVLVFWDGIYEDYTDAATAATNLDNIATNAGTTPWIYIPPIFVEGASLDRTTNIKVIRDNALAAYPDNVFNPYPILEGLAVGVDDDADVAAGRLPRSIYTADEIHLTDAAIDALMTPLIAAIKDKWLLVAGYSTAGTPSTILGGNLLSFIDPAGGGMLQTTGGAAVAADGDRIQVLPDQAGGTFTNADVTLRPTYRNAGGLEWIEARASYLQKSLSRSGDIYICAAFRFISASGSNFISVFYNSPPFWTGNYYALNRWQYNPVGHQLETNSGDNLTAPSNTTDIYVMELLVTATDRTIVLSRDEQLPVTTTAAVAEAIQSTTNMTLFGVDSNTIEGQGDNDLYFYVAADGIPTTEQRNNLVGLASQAAGLTLVPPQ